MKKFLISETILMITLFMGSCSYEKGLTGKVTKWYPAGLVSAREPQEITYYIDGKKIAWEIIDRDWNTIKMFGEKVPDGLVRCYKNRSDYEIGNSWGAFSFKNGKREGQSNIWYENGHLKAIINFKNGKREGQSKSYYENRNLKMITNWKNGKLDGTIKFYNENGSLDTEEYFKNGKMENIYLF